MLRLDLSQIPGLRNLKINVVYDSLDERRTVNIWKGVRGIVRSIPATIRLARLELTSPVPQAVLRAGWISPMVVALQRPMYSVDAALVGLVEQAFARNRASLNPTTMSRTN